MSRRIGGLREIMGEFDAALVDQFGVLHDGRTAFPGARDCLDHLAKAGVPMVALSNSGKRAEPNRARLARLGFPAAQFKDVVTSGELAREEIALRLEDGRLRPGASIAILSRDDDAGVIEGLGLVRAPIDAQADLLLIAGAEPERLDLAAYEALLAPHARRGVPAICANPDLRIYVEGGSDFGPGALAQTYEELGGPTLMLGKPARAMFQAGLARLGDPPPERVLMIGDSPAHDIAGAAAAGCKTLLIERGVQSGEAAEAAPDYATSSLAW